ncbi:serine/threonine-protein kinase PknG [Streptomyces sp. N2-109]|uniref:non-specific serine/threonine protein kinase n=1 Tax=Streptomyces gossypii TaxID=2883101 RepID=A0ABT2JTB0_9ACTN|nr:serine/threonine-protein kinase [Streptomyces gossypii]MCT2590499.1 serine/threonine-protein kinase PknG [Streptomyces gossypii]
MSETPETSRRKCQRPGCTGAYEDMGGGELYCDTCGLAPVVSPGGMIGATPTGLTGAGRGGGSSSSPSSSGRSAGSSGSSRESSRSSSRSSRASARSQSSRRSVSGRLSRSLSLGATASAQHVSVRSSSGSASTSGRGRLGLGLVAVPGVPKADPATVVLDNPEVPERKRFCSSGDCGAPVGRARGTRPGRTEGFCTKCGHPYSFVPKLRTGDVVHGQYEIAGCLAHGGLGWIYLAVDRAVADRWVVLKGLLDTGDEDAMAAAISERRFLAEIEHANIVRIYNFVEHLDRRTGSLDGYIVMEYVGGRSLKELANSRRTPEGRRDPLPVEQACAYGIEALEALAHLHSRNLIYCDFKVDNAIQQDDQLKLIDLGAVRRMDDQDSAIYGTVGYQAPEVAETGPSVASDLYTVARTLAVLTFDFQGYTNVFVDSLPEPEGIEPFRRFESFYRFLVRATDPDPRQRFASAVEMAEQLTGVLREVVSLQTGRPHPAMSTLLGAELRVVDTELLAGASGDTSRLGARRPAARRRGGRGAAVPASGGHPSAVGAVIPGQSAVSQSTGGTALPPAPPPPATTLAQQSQAVGQYGSFGSTPAHVRLPDRPGLPPAPGTPPPGAAVPEAAGPALVPLQPAATALALPVPRVDPGDPNAGYLAGLMTSAPAEILRALWSSPADSIERRLRELRARLEMDTDWDLQAARDVLRDLETGHSDDWRVVWYRGLYALVTGDRETAALAFDAVYDAFPGEPAPKLALGICAEVLGQLDNAAEYYHLVWATDPTYVSAAFGLARVRLAMGDRQGAVRVLESVPEASIYFIAAGVATVRVRLRNRRPEEPLMGDLHTSAQQVERLRELGLDALRQEELTSEVLGIALDWVLAGSILAPEDVLRNDEKLLGEPLDEDRLRLGLERSYRRLARLAQSSTERIELVERANRFRPRTWV